jgi:hypothetical protein
MRVEVNMMCRLGKMVVGKVSVFWLRWIESRRVLSMTLSPAPGSFSPRGFRSKLVFRAYITSNGSLTLHSKVPVVLLYFKIWSALGGVPP